MKPSNRYITLFAVLPLLVLATGCRPATDASSLEPSLPMIELTPAEKAAAIPPDFTYAEDYVLPQSNTLKVDDETLYQIPPEHLPLARNEIAARHGFIFRTEALQHYFEGKSWYQPNPKFSFDALTPVEQYNMALLKFYESMYAAPSDEPPGTSTISLYPPGDAVAVDVNGDGLEDAIQWTVTGNQAVLRINDAVFEHRGEAFASYFGISDIDLEDGRREVIISDLGPSDDYVSTFYSYDGQRIARMGQVGGLAEYGIHIDGSGSFSAQTRGNLLHTWFFDKHYTLTADHKIAERKDEIYRTDCSVFVKDSVQLFGERSLSRPTLVLSPGIVVTIIGTDNEKWCEVETPDGRKGWFALKHFSTLVHEDRPAEELFFGLSFAD